MNILSSKSKCTIFLLLDALTVALTAALTVTLAGAAATGDTTATSILRLTTIIFIRVSDLSIERVTICILISGVSGNLIFFLKGTFLAGSFSFSSSLVANNLTQ